MAKRKRGGLTELDLAWLVTFLTVVESDSQKEAATKLGLDQTTVSNHLRYLRSWVGRGAQVMLFDCGDPPKLTPKGEDVLRMARAVVGMLDQVRTSFVIGSNPKPAIDPSKLKVPGRA